MIRVVAVLPRLLTGTLLRLARSFPIVAITADYIKAGQKAGRIAGEEALTPWLIHSGSDAYERSGVRVIPWRELGRMTGGSP